MFKAEVGGPIPSLLLPKSPLLFEVFRPVNPRFFWVFSPLVSVGKLKICSFLFSLLFSLAHAFRIDLWFQGREQEEEEEGSLRAGARRRRERGRAATAAAGAPSRSRGGASAWTRCPAGATRRAGTASSPASAPTRRCTSAWTASPTSASAAAPRPPPRTDRQASRRLICDFCLLLTHQPPTAPSPQPFTHPPAGGSCVSRPAVD